MRAEIINPFVEASKDVLEQMANMSFDMGKIYIRDKSFDGSDVMILIGLTGEIKGQVMLGMNKDMAKKIVTNMMGGIVIENLDDIAKSAISELGNMILGNTATLLSNRGVTIDITPPTLFVGEKSSVSTTLDKIITVPLNTNCGIIELDIGIKE